VDEISTTSKVAESTLTPYGAIGLAAFHGHEHQAIPLIESAMSDVTARGEGIGVSLTHWARALLCNGLGRHVEALNAARIAAANPGDMGVNNWALAELVEAAVRVGALPTAAAAFERLSARTLASGTDWALGVRARCGAQLQNADHADGLYREAIDRLGSTSLRVELARAQLLHGEWLRIEGRRTEARNQLRAAYDALTAMEVDAFAERARQELAGIGETVRKRTARTRQQLTAQELHIARLAADGHTNPEIAAELFISPRTVEWHLRKVFVKLGVTARRQLREVLRG
jgi:ATP/maltotriose-dependent transcriptional regulator MalT